ncbi:ABC transporter permease [Sporanaerobium hydrogeniformans]|uniref:ABC transporter permease n=1 Tax=Sporanaerobium hydrogeniformans TaxID=3072179 RepID=A0AC61DC68_9FIRM|nr:sugar ABC transporter permease [Sporanaerobium hydrogeniformans]PHV70815.1 ABC transporter permease [Sporanaerobium hydrogeniformans]
MEKHYRNKLSIFIFAFPGLLLFTIFTVYPILPQILISFQKHDGFNSSGWVGFDNYIKVLRSASFWRANGNTLIIVLISLLVALPLSLLLALAIDVQTPKTRNFFKFSSVFPAVLSVTVISQMWVAMYEPQWGLINSFLRSIGLEGWAHQWLTDKSTVVICITIAFLWQYIGLNALLFYTGIKSIPKQYYEAAMIDGANFFKASFFITIPLLTDVIKYVLILSVLGSMSLFAHVRVMTSGGPGDSSRTVIYQMYYTAFSTSEFGVGSAIAVLFIIECLFVTVLINKFTAKERIEF